MFNRKDSKWSGDLSDYLYLTFESFGGCSFIMTYAPYEDPNKVLKPKEQPNYEKIEKNL
jgi:hypothetical protein